MHLYIGSVVSLPCACEISYHVFRYTYIRYSCNIGVEGCDLIKLADMYVLAFSVDIQKPVQEGLIYMRKKILIAIDSELLKELDFVATTQRRTRSEAVREGVRLYVLDHRKKMDTLPPLNVPAGFQGLDTHTKRLSAPVSSAQ